MSLNVRHKHSSVQDQAPQPSDLVNGEIALNINANSTALYTKDSAGNVVKLAPSGGDVDSVFGRTGAVVAADGDYDLGELGDVDLSTAAPVNGQFLAYDGANWVPGDVVSSVDLGYTASATDGTVTNSAGADATVPLVTGADAGLMAPADKTKLDGIQAGAEVNAVDSVFGRTGAVIGAEGDYSLDQLGDVDLTTTPPTTGEVLQYDGSEWVPGTVTASVPDPLTLNTLTVNTLLTAEHIHGNIAGSVYIHVKNTDTVQLAKGTPFYITGTVGASDAVEIQAADSADPAKGPAVGLLEDTLAVNGEGNGTIIGEIYQYDTATPSWNTNDALYVANGGGLTNVEPTSGYRQVVAYAGRIQASTGTLILTGTSTDPVAGSNTQIQFNDNGGFGADSGLTFNKTTNALTVGASTVDGGSAKIYGDINLDDGGSFSTTVQAVTPTANRTISFPDATGTVALVNGANGTIQYNDAGALNGNSDFTVDPDWNDASTVFTGLKLNVTDGAGGSPVGDSDSKLLDLQSGGTSQAFIESDGLGHFGSDANNRVRIGYNLSPPGGAPRMGLFATGGGRLWLTGYGDTYLGYKGTIGITGSNFGFTGSAQGTLDVLLARDDANILAQRNGTASQTYRLYNTYTDASNFERTSLTRDSSGLVIDAQKGGTGADPTNLLDVKLDGASLFSVSSTRGDITTTARNINLVSNTTAQAHIYAGTGGAGNPIDLAGTGGALNTVGLRVNNTGLTIRQSIPVGWAAGTAINTGIDVALARDSAGVVKVTDGSTGDGTISGQLRAVGTAPATASATGTAGDIRYDADYIYVCTATDTWKRAALATW